MRDLPARAFRQLAEFRYRIRRFEQFSEEAAREHGIEPRQHQLLLAIKGLPPDLRPTVTALALRLCLRHHSTVELADRLVERGAIVRRPGEDDRREVLLELTPAGEKILEKLSSEHWNELQTSGPELVRTLEEIVKGHAA